MAQWNVSVEEAEMLLREPKRLRIDILNDMLMNYRVVKGSSKTHKSGKITRTASDVSLSESLYDTLFSEDDGKPEESDKSRSKTKKSLDVSEVVTACLDNMAAKTGITKIQKQSHMDRWLQKAKSKTPEKLQAKVTPPRKEKEIKVISSKKKKKVSPTVPKQKPYSFRKSVYESQNLKSHDVAHDYSSKVNNPPEVDNSKAGYDIGVTAKVELLHEDGSIEEVDKKDNLINDIATTDSLIQDMEVDNEKSTNEVAPTNPIDDTMDEIQVNICSVEENAELENCLVSDQLLNTLEVNPAEHTATIELMPEKEVEKMEDDSAHVDSKLIDSNKDLENMEIVNKSNVSEFFFVESANTTVESENQIESMEVDSGNVSEEIPSKLSEDDSDIQSVTQYDLEKKIEAKGQKEDGQVLEELTENVVIDFKKVEESQIGVDKDEKSETEVLDDKFKQDELDKPLLLRKKRFSKKKSMRNKPNIEVDPETSNQSKSNKKETEINVIELDKLVQKAQVSEMDKVTSIAISDSLQTALDKNSVVLDDHHIRSNYKPILRRSKIPKKCTESVKESKFEANSGITLNDEKQIDIVSNKLVANTLTLEVIKTLDPHTNKEDPNKNHSEKVVTDTAFVLNNHQTRSSNKRLSLRRRGQTKTSKERSETKVEDDVIDSENLDKSKESVTKENDDEKPRNDSENLTRDITILSKITCDIAMVSGKQEASLQIVQEAKPLETAVMMVPEIVVDSIQTADKEVNNENAQFSPANATSEVTKEDLIVLDSLTKASQENLADNKIDSCITVSNKTDLCDSLSNKIDSCEPEGNKIDSYAKVDNKFDLYATVNNKFDSYATVDNKINSCEPDSASVQIPADNTQDKDERQKCKTQDTHQSHKQHKPPENGCYGDVVEEDIEYGHLEFIQKESMQGKPVTQHIAHIEELPPEEDEYGHLDFIFSSSKEFETYTDASKPTTCFETANASLSLDSTKDTKNELIILPNSENNNTVPKISQVKSRELRVSVEKLPFSSLPNSALLKLRLENKDVENLLQNNIRDSDCMKDEKVYTERHTETLKEPEKRNGNNNHNVNNMSVDEDLDEKLILDDSFEKITDTKEINCKLTDKHAELVNEFVENAESEKLLANEQNPIVETESNIVGDSQKKSISVNITQDGTTERKKAHSEKKSLEKILTYDKNTDYEMSTHDKFEIRDKMKATRKYNDSVNADTCMSPVNRLPEPVKLNGFHVDECIDFSDGELNAETSSINSVDSEPLAVTKTKLLLKRQSAKALNDTEFVKYLELRQDDLMDQHPELTEADIVEYLYNTWQYEESSKSDLVKSDDIEQSGLVKGLDKNLRKKTIRNSFRESKKQKKKQDEDTSSINSDISDTSVKRRLRIRTPKSPATSVEEDISLNSGMSLVIKTELLDNISTNSDVSNNSVQRTISIDNKLSEAFEFEAKDDSVSNLNNHNIVKNTPDKVNYDPEEITHKKSSEKEKTESPDTKDTSIKSYYYTAENSANEAKNSTDDGKEKEIKIEYDPDTVSLNSEDSEISTSRKKQRKYGEKQNRKSLTDPEFLKYVEMRQDTLIDENPQLSHDEIVEYLFKTWLYEESVKSDIKKTDELEQATLVKGLNEGAPQPKKVKKRVKVEKDYIPDDEVQVKDKPKRKTSQPYYNENISDIEEEIELFEIFKPKKKFNVSTNGGDVNIEEGKTAVDEVIDLEEYGEEFYFSQLTLPKPNVFKGLVREKVCEICEITGNLVKCKGCNCMFHVECVKKAAEVVELPAPPTRGKKKKKKCGRKPKALEDSESQSDDKSQDVSEEFNVSVEDELESRTVNADDFEAVLQAKMQELLPSVDTNYDSYSSDDGLDWNSSAPGICEIVDVKLKPKVVTDHSNFKCHKCEKHSLPVCFVCKEAVSKTGVEHRQRCQTAHCYKYYHLECLEHWPQTQYHAGETSKTNKKLSEHFEALMCPRHVCHTCVSDDPRGCKTRFSGDKLARCVRCPATYHTFTKCLPAGTQILTGSLIVCPRHYEHR